MQLLVDIAGWTGSFMIVISYALSQTLKRDLSRIYMFLNMIGGFMIAINCLYYNAIPSLVTNVIWSFIAMFSIYRARKHFNRRYRSP